ncbi:hypothetical protein CMT52_11280 [Elizabethkingia anophelis]|nr:hypothetical protein [Elizabethkingia anophelis]
MISEQEYNKLISIARSKFPNCYEDVVHDAVLLGLSFDECAKRLKWLSFNYFTVNKVDLTRKYEEKACIHCNRCLPISCFRIYTAKNLISTRNVCIDCCSKNDKKWNSENPDYHREYLKEWRKRNPKKVKKHNSDNYINNKDKIKEGQQKWQSENKMYRKEYFKMWRRGIKINKEMYLQNLKN